MHLVEGFVPGAISRIVALHNIFYAREWQMGQAFEALVAQGLNDFSQRYDKTSDLVLLALDNNEEIIGSLVLDLHDPASDDRGAHLRFFIMDDCARGTGIGGQMLRRAMTYCDKHSDGKCWLTTFGGLDAARRMYEKHGFRLIEEVEGTRWGIPLLDQTFQRP